MRLCFLEEININIYVSGNCDFFFLTVTYSGVLSYQNLNNIFRAEFCYKQKYIHFKYMRFIKCLQDVCVYFFVNENYNIFHRNISLILRIKSFSIFIINNFYRYILLLLHSSFN